MESQGRETLYNVQLPDGSILRSIQGMHTPVRIGETVEWGVNTASMLVFDQDGRRL